MLGFIGSRRAVRWFAARLRGRLRHATGAGRGRSDGFGEGLEWFHDLFLVEMVVLKSVVRHLPPAARCRGSEPASAFPGPTMTAWVGP